MKYLQHLGKPWVCGAEGPDSFDCWGLLKTIYRESFGIEISPLAPGNHLDVSQCAKAAALIVASGNWREVKEPREGDAIALSRRSAIHHVGVFLAGRRVLHTVSGNGVIVQSFKSLKLNGFTKFIFYRHNELCKDC